MREGGKSDQPHLGLRERHFVNWVRTQKEGWKGVGVGRTETDRKRNSDGKSDRQTGRQTRNL